MVDTHTTYHIVVPVRTVTGMNVREHPMARAGRVKREKAATLLALQAAGVRLSERPLRVLFVRVSPVLCDDDAIPPACKAIRDAIAKAFGVSDGPGRGITWAYDQAKGKLGAIIPGTRKRHPSQHEVRLTIETSYATMSPAIG